MELEESLRALGETLRRESGEPDSEEAKARREASLQNFMASMSTVYGVIGIATALAAPRALARMTEDDCKAMTQERVLRLLDDYLVIVDTQRAGERDGVVHPMVQSEEAVRRFRALLATWPFGPVAPEPLVRTAREILPTFGIVVSDEELDQWEGPPEPGASSGGASEAGR